MDSGSHILLGASIGQLCLGEKWGRKAWLWGAVAGSFPDFDVIFQNLFSAAGSVLFHRGISHSFFVAVILLPLLAWLINKRYKGGRATYFEWLTMFSIAWASHLVVDMFNTYGAGFFLPFSRARLAFDSINVIDIIFISPLLLAFVFFLLAKTNRIRSMLVGGALFLSMSYLAFTIINKIHIEDKVRSQLKEQAISYNRMITSPLPMSNFAWMVVVEEPGEFKVGTYFQVEQNKIDFVSVPKNHELSNSFRNTRDFEKLERFTKGYYVLKEGENGDITLIDLRFSSLSNLEPSTDMQFAFQFVMDVDNNGKLKIKRTRPKRYLTRNNMRNYFRRVFTRSVDKSKQGA